MPYASQLLFNAVILTLDAHDTVASAIALDGDRILAVGTLEDLAPFVGPDTIRRDMEGKTVMPGFYDAHGHILLTASMLDWEDLNSPPIGTCRTLEDCLSRLRERAAKTPAGEWILAYGFDDTLMEEKRFPTRTELDSVSTEHPILVQHISIHFGTLNSAGFAALGIDRDTPDPEGGVIRREADGSLHGVVEERALFDLVSPRLPVFSREHQVQNIARTSREVYAARGITTALDAGVLDYDSAEALRETCERGLLAVRAHINPYYYLDRNDPRLHFEGQITTGGVKIMSDGSLQGFPAFLSKPYHTPFKGDPNYKGYPAYSREELFAIVEEAHRNGQFLIHANGDGAMDDALDALEAAQAKYPREGCRHILIHAQTIRDDQLDRLGGLHAHVLRTARLLLGRSAPRHLPRARTRPAHGPHPFGHRSRLRLHVALRHADHSGQALPVHMGLREPPHLIGKGSRPRPAHLRAGSPARPHHQRRVAAFRGKGSGLAGAGQIRRLHPARYQPAGVRARSPARHPRA